MASPPILIRAPLGKSEEDALRSMLRRRGDQSPPQRVLCDVASVGADVHAVDRLARLELSIRRSGGQLRLRNPSDELRELIAFMGLAGVLRR